MQYRGVVRVFATTQAPDHDNPWQSRTPQSSTGSGVVIRSRQILTGAHVVADATFLQVQKISSPEKVLARVAAICHDADLALLSVDDPAFFDDISPASLGDLPELRDKVSVVGYPIGGEEISITEGVVSRVEVQRYSHSQRVLLAVTVDAAINAGNSGGPVFRGENVVGIAHQKLENADNIGEMVPTPLIRRFLDAVATGRSTAVPSLGILVQGLENSTLRTHLGMPVGETGVRVAVVDHGGSASGCLEVGDVLLAVDGHIIANNHTIQLRPRLRTRFDVLLGLRHIGDSLTMTVRRDGARMDVNLVMRPHVDLVPRDRYDVRPSYYIYGGLVFQRLTRDYLGTWNQWWKQAPKEFLHLYYSGIRTPSRREVVVLSHILADAVNCGYDNLHDESVIAVNGAPVLDFESFVATLDAAEGTVVLTLSKGGLLVLDAKQAHAVNPSILARYNIMLDRSSDLARSGGRAP